MNSPIPTVHDAAIKTFIEGLPQDQRTYAARYAHWLVEQPNHLVARDHAEAAKAGIPIAKRLTIRRKLLKIVRGQDDVIRLALQVGI